MKKRLVVGLGNIGEKYTHTRHNIGFKIVEQVAKQKEAEFEPVNFGSMAKTSHKGREILLLKPDTYMNLSGNAVEFWMKKEKIEPENLLVVVDDLHLPFGVLRLRNKGSNAGHNGLKSIEDCLKTNQYNRLKFGVGNDAFNKINQVDFVLGNWNEQEATDLHERIEKASEMIFSFVFAGATNTMNAFNGK